MAHLQVIRHRPPTMLARLRDSLRSFTLGPFNLKDKTLVRYFGSTPNAAGVSVSEDTALMYAAVWQAVTLIAGDVASLPLVLYKRDREGGKTRYHDHPLYELLHTAPNPDMSSMTVRETLQAHVLTWGNGYAEIERDGAGRPVALWPLLPTQVEPYRDDRRQLRYRVRNPSGTDVTLTPSQMLHLHGLGFDGTVGYSVIHQARESLGLLAASERFGATFFGNGTTFGGALKHPKVLGVEGAKNLRESVEAFHRGADKAHRFLILEEGMDFTKFGVDPNDAQFLETRQFQIAEVARWFNLPLHKLREMEHSSVRANIEQEALDYYVATLRPWLVRWEQELNRKLVSPFERHIQHIEFVLDGVLRGDMKSRYDSYAVGRQWGWLSVNEIRALENMGPIADGDKFLSPMNMVPADRLDEVIDKQVAPPPPPPPPGDDDEDAERDDEAERAAVAECLARLEAQATAIGVLQARCETAAGALADAEAARADLQTTVEQLRADLAEGRTSHAAVTAERDALVRDTTAQIDAMTATVDETQAARDTLVAERDALAASLAAARAEIETSAVKALEADAVRAASEAAWGDRLNAVALEVAEATRAAQAAVEGQTAAEQRAADAERRVVEAEAGRVAAERQAADVDALRAAIDAKSAEAEAGRIEAVEACAALRASLLGAEQRAADADRRATEAEAAKAEAEAAAAAARLAAEASEAARATAVETQATRLAAAVTAARAVTVDAVGRLVRREAEKARSKRQTPDKLRTWAASFYDDHEVDLWVDALQPVMALHVALLGTDVPTEDATRALVAAHMDASKRQLLAVAASDPEDYGRALDATLQRWETTRAAAVADDFLRQEIEHVRAIQ